MESDRSRDVAMATNFKVKIGKIELLAFIRTLTFQKGSQYRYFDLQKFILMIWLHCVRIWQTLVQ